MSESERRPIPRCRPESRWLSIASLLPSALAVIWLVSKAQWFWNHVPDLEFGWIVLGLCGYLWWDAWQTRPRPEYRFRGILSLPVAAGAGILFLVQIYQAALGTNAASIAGLALGLTLFVMGNVGYVFGHRGIRHFAFSFCFLLIALPMPSLLHNLLVGGLQSKIALLNVELLNVIGIPARRVGSVIQLSSCTVGVDEACSGIRSLQSTVMAALFVGHFVLRRSGLKAILVASGVLLAVVGNLTRSLFLSYTAHSRGLEALHEMHDSAGWSILLFTAAGLAALAWLFSKIENISASRSSSTALQGQDP